MRRLRLLVLTAALATSGCIVGPQPDGGDDGNGGDGGNGNAPPTSVSLELIVRTGDSVPGQANATFTYFGNPIIDNDGRVAFYAAYSGGRGGAGLYVWHDGTLERIYDTDPVRTDPVPDRPNSDHYGGLTIRWDRGAPHLAWGANGRLLFAAHINDNPQPNILVRWRARDEDLFLVGDDASLQAIIPDASGDFLPEYYHPGVSDAGIAIFSNRYSYFREDGSFSLFNLGIFTTDGRTTEEVGVGQVPGQEGAATFSNKPVLLTTHNARGEFLFQAEYEGGSGDRGVYLLSDGQLSRVIDNAPNRSFPGLPAGAQVGTAGTNFQAIALGSAGHIAIDTTLTIGGSTRDAVLLWDGTRWYELQDPQGNPATDLLGGVSASGQTIFLADGRPYLGDGESVVSLAETLPTELRDVELTWENFGGAINNPGRAVLRYRRQESETPGLVFWSGEQLFVVLDAANPTGLEAIDVIFPEARREPDALDRVGTIAARPETNRPGLSGMINDRDEWVFRVGTSGPDGLANTEDDQQALLLGRGE